MKGVLHFWHRVFALLVFSASLLVAREASESSAQPSPEEVSGIRSSGPGKAVNSFFNYTAEGLAVRKGGYRQGYTFEGLADFGIEFTAEREGRTQSIHLSAMYLHGDDPSAALVGDFSSLSNIVGRSGLRFFEAYYLWNKAGWTVMSGLIAADDIFAISEAAELFINSSFGPLPSVAANSGVPVWPLAAPGFVLRRELSPYFVDLGLYDGDAGSEEDNRHGTRIRLSRADGVMALLEIGRRWNVSGREGQLKIGGWAHSGLMVDFSQREKRGNYGLHLIGNQAIAPNGRGTVFTRIGIAPLEARAPVRLQGDAGLSLSVPFPSRTEDLVGLAYFFTEFSSDYLERRATDGAKVTRRESGLEVTYSLALNQGVTLQPDFQYIFSAHESARDALAIMVRVTAEL